MSLRILVFCALRPIVLLAATLVCGSTASLAQSSGVSAELHANSHVTAAQIGLPGYPGATLYKDPANDSAFDLGFTFGDFHFRVMAANYMTSASPTQVLDFYRKPLSRYGEVLECDHGKAVGSFKVARGGLACSDKQGDPWQMSGQANSSTDHELRAGTPHQFRIVGIDESQLGSTRFAVVLLEVPKDNGSDGKSK
jgi:hypothetical protein